MPYQREMEAKYETWKMLNKEEKAQSERFTVDMAQKWTGRS